MVEKMTEEESKVQRAIRAARIAKQKLLEETRNAFALEDDTEVVKVKRPKAEKVTIKVPNQDKEGYGLAGVEEEYKIKKDASVIRSIIEDIEGEISILKDTVQEYASDGREQVLKTLQSDLEKINQTYQ
jgi:hypothetical protein